MKKYFVPMKVIKISLERSNNSFIRKTLIDYHNNELTLYVKNTNENYVFKIVNISYNKYGIIIETDKVPSYFKNSFIEIKLKK